MDWGDKLRTGGVVVRKDRLRSSGVLALVVRGLGFSESFNTRALWRAVPNSSAKILAQHKNMITTRCARCAHGQHQRFHLTYRAVEGGRL
jgi:hypothetical protein